MCGCLVCCIRVTAFFVTILTMVESLSLGSSLTPNSPRGGSTPQGLYVLTWQWTATAPLRSLRWAVPVLQEGFLCKIFVEVCVGEKPKKPNSITSRLTNNDIFFHLAFNCTKQQDSKEIQLSAGFRCCVFTCSLWPLSLQLREYINTHGFAFCSLFSRGCRVGMKHSNLFVSLLFIVDAIYWVCLNNI